MTTFDAAALGPYVGAAAVIHGPATGDRRRHLDEVLATAIALAVGAETAGPAAVRDIPIRSFEVTGVLSVDNTNAYRTQIGIDTGQSSFGADQMWTAMEDPAVALRTRAVLQGLVGQRVSATKETFHEYNADGSIKLDGKKPLTRTRLKPGSLYLITTDGSRIPVDLAADPPTPEADAAASTQRPETSPPQRTDGDDSKPPYVDAAVAHAWLVEQIGRAAADEAWGSQPRTGPLARTTLNELRRSVVHATV